MKDPYDIQFAGRRVDPYRILRLYNIVDPCLQHAIKKLLRAGRGTKPIDEDVGEAINTLLRWSELREEDRAEERVSPEVLNGIEPHRGSAQKEQEDPPEGIRIGKYSEHFIKP